MNKIKLPVWNIEEMTGYKPQTTFWIVFSIADKFGLDAVKNTFERVFKEWKSNIVFVTELTMVINHKCWEHWNRANGKMIPFSDSHNEIGQWYKDKYYEMLDWADKNLKGRDLDYFYKALD